MTGPGPDPDPDRTARPAEEAAADRVPAPVPGRRAHPPAEAPDVDLLPDRTTDEVDLDRPSDDADRRLREDRPPHWDA